MMDTSALARLMEAAKRRAILQLLLDHGSLAFAYALGALIVLLLLGTQVLDWYWPLLLLLIVSAIGVAKVRGRVPSSYDVAQRVDLRLQSNDSISTAVFFQAEQTAYGHAELVEAQRRGAELIAASSPPAAAVPYTMPRQAWVCTGLFAISVSLLAIRYGMSGSLDLTQPLVHIPFESFAGSGDAKKQQKFAKQKLPDGLDAFSVPSGELDELAGDRKTISDDDLFRSESIDSGMPAGKDAQSAVNGSPSEDGGKDSGEAGDKGEGAPGGDDRGQKDGNKGAGPQNAKSPGQGGNQNPGQPSNENSSLMDKMKDAMANMLSRMKMNPQQGESGRQNTASQQGGSQGNSAQKQAGQKGAPSPGQKGEGQAQSDDAGEQEGEGASKMNAQGKMSDSAGAKQQTQEGKSGAGKQDGDKDIRDAEQAAAMGKISEILGKRAQNLTGEIMVEVSSGRQQLKTQYTQKNAAHADAGGEITRDEVPAAYQDFVQKYFEEVRKTAAPKPEPKSK
ncbi:MAG: hypothetical protein HYZ37_06080 [Candidatus Solibacter usitatus]|nr:hypothetical protein [Candidatus Solibacter usitatus]